MTQKKGAPQKPAPRRPAGKKKSAAPRSGRKRRPPANQFQRVLLGVSLLIGLVVAVGFVADRLIERRPAAPPRARKPAATLPVAPKAPQASPPAPAKPSVTAKPATTPQAAMPVAPQEPPPVFEVYPKHDLPAITVPIRRPPADQLPKVAIIIDDLGYDRDMAQKFLLLDTNLTASILPNSPFEKDVRELARREGVEAMLHLPMEPDEYPSVTPGPDALLTSMTPDELIAQLERDLDAVPEAKGVNNHMGSRLTRESPQMQQVLSVLKQRGLYFVDSRTTAETVGRSTARLFRVPFAERDIFLDHDPKTDVIRGQILKLIQRAVKQGQAVGIAHPHASTYEVLRQMLPELKKTVRLVPASQVVHDWS